MYNSALYLLAVDSTFVSNYGPLYSGALANNGAGITAQNCMFFNNSAVTNGGAIGASLDVTSINSTYTYNKCANGGAIYGRIVVSQNSVFMYNGGTRGAGIFNYGYSVITNSTFSYNIATERGGAIWTQGDLITIYIYILFANIR